MGFLKKLFAGKDISAEEQRRRAGGVRTSGGTLPEKPWSEMTEEERVSRWVMINEIPDILERMSRMKEIAEQGYGVACICMHNDYWKLAHDEEKEPQWEQMIYWAKKAIDYGAPAGHLHLGNVYNHPGCPDFDIGKAAKEFFLAMEYGDELAATFLANRWNYRNDTVSAEENEELRQIVRKDITENIKPEIARLQEEKSAVSFIAFGLMYFYGIYFEQDLNEAKRCFEALSDMGYDLGKRMLENPIFEDDEEDEEDEE